MTSVRWQEHSNLGANRPWTLKAHHPCSKAWTWEQLTLVIWPFSIEFCGNSTLQLDSAWDNLPENDPCLLTLQIFWTRCLPPACCQICVQSSQKKKVFTSSCQVRVPRLGRTLGHLSKTNKMHITWCRISLPLFQCLHFNKTTQ